MSNNYKGHALEALNLKGALIEQGSLYQHDDVAGFLCHALERAYEAGHAGALSEALDEVRAIRPAAPSPIWDAAIEAAAEVIRDKMDKGGGR